MIESIIHNRKAIGVDLNPIAIFQTKIIASHFKKDKFEKIWKELYCDLRKFEKDCKLFETKCTNCGKNARYYTVNREYDKPYNVFYKCDCKKGYLEKEIDSEGLKKINDAEKYENPFRYPNFKFPKTTACALARKNYGETYDKLFTKRNLLALSFIFSKINELKDEESKMFFRFAFISMVHLVSKIPSVRENSERVASGSWGRPTFIKMRKYMEQNPFVCFERAIEFRQGILKGKKSSNDRIKGKTKFAENQKELHKDKNLFLLNKNILQIENEIAENSIDFVITDPPYGNLIPYFDLSSIWSVWLQLIDSNYKMPFDDEILIDDERNFSYVEYTRKLGLAFGKIYRLLKPGKYMIVTFHNDEPLSLILF